jgi:hypothetical protein
VEDFLTDVDVTDSEAALVASSVAAEAVVMTVVAEGVVAMTDVAGDAVAAVMTMAVASADISY